MRGLLAVVVALGVGYFVYQSYFSQGGPAGGPPQQQIDVVGVETDLRSMATAERQFFVTHGRYATLEELENQELLTGGAERRGYRFTADVNGSTGFSIVAEPVDPDKAQWPTLSIDETMQVSRQ
jgi:hypothetical protein